MSQALYRKYRPQIFEDVVGQEQIERTIKNAIEQDKVSHAYLFCGPRGTGKTTTARLLAKALLCEDGPTPSPCGKCKACKDIAEGIHPDVHELDAASRTGVDNVRDEIISRVQYAPTQGRFKVYIIDEVHMLTVQAFNALLKTLEEPPAHVVFILATTDPQKVPETIHSRCQRFDFRGISSDAIVSRLGAVCVSEGVEFEGDALELIAHYAKGGMRNALTTLEQAITFGEGKVTLDVATSLLGAVSTSDTSKIVGALGTQNAAECFKIVAELAEAGTDIAQFTTKLAGHIRNLYVMAVSGGDVALDVSASTLRQLEHELPAFGQNRLSHMLDVLGQTITDMKASTNPRLTLEIALTRMVHPEGDLTLEALAARIEQLECTLASSNAATPQVPNQVRPQQISQPTMHAQTQVPVATTNAAPSQMRQQQTSQQNPTPAQAQASQMANVSTCAPEGATAKPTMPTTTSTATPQATSQQRAVNNVALQRRWQSAIAILKRTSAPHALLFTGTSATFDRPTNTVSIVFPQGSAFTYKSVQKPGILKEVTDAFTQACDGLAFNINFTLKEGSTAAPTTQHIKNEPKKENTQPAPMANSVANQNPPSNKAQNIDDTPPWENVSSEPADEQKPSEGQKQTKNKRQQTIEETQQLLQDAFGSDVTFEEVSE